MDLTGASALIDGATGGAIATVAMSAVMIAGDRTGLMGEQPPTTITRFALREAGVDRPSAAVSRIAPLTHLGFGALGGAVFGLIRRLVPGVPGGLLGVSFGLAVWAVSYKGWIPALGILPTPEDDRPGRPRRRPAGRPLSPVTIAPNDWLVASPRGRQSVASRTNVSG